MFTEISLNHTVIKNRIARSATNDHLGFPDGTVSPAQVREYEELAAGGAGLIFTGHLSVSRDHRADPFQNRISDDSFIPGLSELVRVSHAHGAVIYAQISHAGSKGVNPVDFNAFTQEDIDRTVREFAQGAERAARAGFDGVQIHLAHGYLLSEVLDERKNRRRDAYGGSDENRLRLVRTIVEEVRRVCPASFGIAIKIHANDSSLVPQTDRLVYYVRELADAGICAAEVSGWDFKDRPAGDECYYLAEAAELRRRVDIPVILVGGIHSRETIQRTLDAGIDMASLCRTLIAEPDFPEKLARGEEEDSRCLRCSRCFSLYRECFTRCVFGREDPQLRANFGNL